MVWLAKKAFFGHVPFPVINIDTGKKLPEIYAFRDAIRQGLEARSDHRRTVRRSRTIDPTLPPATRAAARKTAGAEAVIADARASTASSPASAATRKAPAPRSASSARATKNSDWDVRDQPPEFWNQFKTDFAAGHPRAHPPAAGLDRARHLGVHQARETSRRSPLYFARDGKRYRCLGGRTSRFPIESNADDHRRDHRRAGAHQHRRALRPRAWTTKQDSFESCAGRVHVMTDLWRADPIASS